MVGSSKYSCGFVAEHRWSSRTQLTFVSDFSVGFEKPSAIQQRAIKPIVRGRDVIAQ